jgi:hypothetical protein
MTDLFVIVLVCVAFVAGVVITLHDAWRWWCEWSDRRARRVPKAHPHLTREPWQETPELGSGKHRRLDYSDIKIEEDEP